MGFLFRKCLFFSEVSLKSARNKTKGELSIDLQYSLFDVSMVGSKRDVMIDFDISISDINQINEDPKEAGMTESEYLKQNYPMLYYPEIDHKPFSLIEPWFSSYFSLQSGEYAVSYSWDHTSIKDKTDLPSFEKANSFSIRPFIPEGKNRFGRNNKYKGILFAPMSGVYVPKFGVQ
jgi:hypothetical protein